MHIRLQASGIMCVLLVSLGSGASAGTIPGFAEANDFYNRGDYAKAEAQYRKLAEKYANDASVHYMLGMCYSKMGKLVPARNELTWVASYSMDPKIKQYAAASLARLGSTPAAAPAVSSKSGGGTAHGAPTSPFDPIDAPPRNLINDSVSETVRVAAERGWKPCPGKCLKLSTPGWHKQEEKGHPPSDNWFTFHDGGGTNSFSQYHAGHLIENGKDIGPCPNCGGNGWVRIK